MDNKKSMKKAPKKADSKREVKKSISLSDGHGHFLGVLLLFVGVSLYSILSFWDSNNDRIQYMYSSAIHSSEEIVATAEIPEDSAPVQIFTDVTVDHINAKAIESLYYEGIISGYDNGSFKPDNVVNRAEFMIVLTNVVDADFGGKSLKDCFTDVGDDWFAHAVCYAKENGWVGGFNDGSFRPAQAITKAEVLKMAFEAVDYHPCEVVSSAPYEDVPLDAWYAIYACSGRIGGIIPGAGLFEADHQVTRAELSQIIYNLLVAKDQF